MNPSVYSALFKTLEDEAEGAAGPLPAEIEVKDPEPTQLASLGVAPPEDPKETLRRAFAQFSAPEIAEPTDAPQSVASPTPAPAGTPKLDANVPATPSNEELVRSRVAEMMKMYGPKRTPHANQNEMAANIGRIGSNLGAAIAGVKADNSFYDGLEKQGATSAAKLDAADSEYDQFKRALMTKALGDQEKGDPELEDPNSMKYKSAVAYFKSDTILGPAWDDYEKQARLAGVVPSVNTFNKNLKGSNALAARTSKENNRAGIDARDASREDSQQFTRENMAISAELGVANRAYEDELKRARDMSGSIHPNRPVLRPGIDDTSARHVRELDADAQFINKQITDLRAKIKQHGPDVFRAIPGFRGDIISLRQSIASAILRANGYGVPTGNDWKMVDNEIGDPTRLVDLVTKSADTQLQQAVQNITARTDARARETGYGDYSPGSGITQHQATPRPQAPNVRGIVQGGAGSTPAPPPVAEVSPDKPVLVQDENGKKFRVPASAVQKWIAKTPGRKALE